MEFLVWQKHTRNLVLTDLPSPSCGVDRHKHCQSHFNYVFVSLLAEWSNSSGVGVGGKLPDLDAWQPLKGSEQDQVLHALGSLGGLKNNYIEVILLY